MSPILETAFVAEHLGGKAAEEAQGDVKAIVGPGHRKDLRVDLEGIR